MVDKVKDALFTHYQYGIIMASVEQIRKIFLTINQSRLDRCQESLRSTQRPFLQVLPLLFHVNAPTLPGYVADQVPSGVFGYVPTNAASNLAKNINSSFILPRRSHLLNDIEAIFLMGSSGTVAYSQESDFDIWLCHNPRLTQEQIALLQEKASAIEQWASQLKLEVHFFLMNAEQFKKGRQQELSSESSGSAQHHLLLDEFYRTSIYLAGKNPSWWLVPPDQEENYDQVLDDIFNRFPDKKIEFVDLGKVAPVPAEEFFGAGLWQVYKGIDSPYKSLMKILLMEIYASEYPHIELLSLIFKRAVYSGIDDLDQLDPYIIMINKLQAYLSGQENLERLELLRRCFYFKISLNLSQTNSGNDWRTQLMRTLVQNWGWGPEQLQILDNRQQWRIDYVSTEKNRVIKELTRSYLFLSGFAKDNGSLTMLKQDEMNIIGRKLYAAFERKSGKIALVNRGIDSEVKESHISLYDAPDKEGNDRWLLYRGHVPANQLGSTRPINWANNVFELLAWSHFNQVVSKRTAIAINRRRSTLNNRECDAIFKTLGEHFPEGSLPSAPMQAFATQSHIKQALLFINVGHDTTVSAEPTSGHATVGNIKDALNYGVHARNQVNHLDLLIINSWNEVLTLHFNGAQGLLDLICQQYNWHRISPAPTAISCFCHSSSIGALIGNRVNELIQDVFGYFSDSSHVQHNYLIQIENQFYSIFLQQGKLESQAHGNLSGLMRHLNSVRKDFCHYKPDRHALTHSAIPLILSNNIPDTVQLFYKSATQSVDIFMLDELGSLHFQKMASCDVKPCLSHFNLFLRNYWKRLDMENATHLGTNAPVRFYHIYNSDKGMQIKELFDVDQNNEAVPTTPLLALATRNNDQFRFTFYLDDQEYSSIEHGNEVFALVANEILQLRTNKDNYPIYITDIDISTEDNNQRVLQTIQVLKYKKFIEDKLNGALKPQPEK